MGSIGRLFAEIVADTGGFTSGVNNAIRVAEDGTVRLTGAGRRMAQQFETALNPTAKLSQQIQALELSGKKASDIALLMGNSLQKASRDAIAHGQTVDPLVKKYAELATSGQSMAAKIGAALGPLGGMAAGFGIAGGMAGIVSGIKSVISASIDFEAAFVGVRKTVDATDAELNKLSASILEMSTRMPVAAEQLARIAEVGGQLGIKPQNIEKFTDVIAKMAVATNLSADEAATSMAQFANVMGSSQSDFEKIGAVIAKLGDSGSSTEKQITEMAQRLAASARLIGLSEPQVLAFAASLANVGIEAEAGGTAFSKTFADIQKSAATGSKELRLFAAVSGESVEGFKRMVALNPAEAIMKFVQGLSGLEKQGQNAFVVLEALGITEQRQQRALLSSSLAAQGMTESFKLANEEWKTHNKLNQEFDKYSQTASARIQMMKNAWHALAVELGDLVSGPMKGIANALKDIATGEAFKGIGQGGVGLTPGGFPYAIPGKAKAKEVGKESGIRGASELGPTWEKFLAGTVQYYDQEKKGANSVSDALAALNDKTDKHIDKLMSVGDEWRKIINAFYEYEASLTGIADKVFPHVKEIELPELKPLEMEKWLVKPEVAVKGKYLNELTAQMDLISEGWRSMSDTMMRSMTTAFGDMLSGARTLRDGLRGIWNSIKQSFLDMIGSLMSNMVMGWLKPAFNWIGSALGTGMGSVYGVARGGASMGAYGMGNMGAIAASGGGIIGGGGASSGAGGLLGAGGTGGLLGSALPGIGLGGMLGGAVGGSYGAIAGGLGGALLTSGISGGMAAGAYGGSFLGGMSGAMGALLTNPWTAVAVGAALAGTLIYKSLTRGGAPSGAKESQRDFNVSINSQTIDQFIQSIGLSKSGYEGIRKDISSSPKYLTEVLFPQAKMSGATAEFLRKLESVETAWGVFNFRSAFEKWMTTGDSTALNKAFIAAFSTSQRLQEVLPDWQQQLMADGDKSTSTTTAKRVGMGLGTAGPNYHPVTFPTGTRDNNTPVVINNYFNIDAIDADGVRRIVREQIAPTLVDELEMNRPLNGRSITFKTAMAGALT